MTESTPTTDEVRDSWLGEPGRYHLFGPTVEEFDRWLNSIKAEAGVEALRNYASAVREYGRPNAWDKSDVADDVEIWADELEAEK